MAPSGGTTLARSLVKSYGATLAESLGVDLVRAGPSDLFRLLCAAMLTGAPIRHSVALQAARALAENGWTNPRALASSRKSQRGRVLRKAGYARWNERAATMLGDSAKAIVERWRGDLRLLRLEADRDPQQERRLLKELPGVGDVVVDIFFRDLQLVWDELAPFADRRALEVAKSLKLPADSKRLARLVPKRDFPRLVAALVNVNLQGVEVRKLA
jgi:endonuclease III